MHKITRLIFLLTQIAIYELVINLIIKGVKIYVNYQFNHQRQSGSM